MSATKPLAHEQGQTAESLAADFFRAQGYRVAHRNYRSRMGEVDLVVERDPLLVFVEVRYRRSAAFGSPEETVTHKKRRRVVLAALRYLVEHPVKDRCIRFDVVAVRHTQGGPKIEHIAGAFDADLGREATLVI